MSTDKSLSESTNQEITESSYIDYIAKTIDERDHSVWTTGNDSRLNNSINDHHNKTVDEFHDQDSNWTVNQSSRTIDNSINDHHNKTVDAFHDQDSNWTVNQSSLSGFNELHDEENKNLAASRFSDQDSNRPKKSDHKHDVNIILTYKNLTVPQLNDQDANSNLKLNQEKSHLPKILNEQNNQSMLQANIIQETIFDSNEKKLNCKLKINEEEIENFNDKVKYSRNEEGFVMRVNSLDDFFLQIEDADMHLMNMKTDLEKCRKNFDKTPQLGTICVAPYHIDKQFYRAQIIEIEKSNANFSLTMNPNSSFNTSVNKFNEPKVRVHYIDYGNEDVVDLNEIYKITTELKNIAPLALNCRLNLSKKLKNWIQTKADLNQDVTPELQKCFKKITSKSKIKLKVIKELNIQPKNGENIHVKPPALLVDAFLGDENICDSLLGNTLISHQSSLQIFERKKSEKKEIYFEGYLIELKPLNKTAIHSSYEINIQNKSVLNLIEELSTNFSNLSDSSSRRNNLAKESLIGLFGFAPLPKILGKLK